MAFRAKAPNHSGSPAVARVPFEALLSSAEGFGVRV